MAQAGNSVPQRPLSPHLQIWHWGANMVVSILHRATGSANVVGLLVLLWWLGALASGPDAYETFFWAMSSPLGLLVLAGISVSVSMHLCSGLRHFVLDTGAGYKLTINRAWSIACPLLGIVGAAVFWALVLFL